jgi:hypothetical protein
MADSAQSMDLIDAVICWVDGSDPVHREKREKYALKEASRPNFGLIKAGLDETRFADNGELIICVRLIKKFAPWINKIFIVTDDQNPDLFSQPLPGPENIEIIDHRVIFNGYTEFLPIFNSRSIESLIWNIPGLSEKFIYFNDDFFIVNPVYPDDFFVNGKAVLRGHWRRLGSVGRVRVLFEGLVTLIFKKIFRVNRTMHLLAQKRAARVAGFENRYFWTPHIPHPMRKSALSNFFERQKSTLLDNLVYRFRSSNQFWPISLANHLMISSGQADLVKECCNFDFIADYHSEGRIKVIERMIFNGEVKFLCVGGLENANQKTNDKLKVLLGTILSSDS